METGAGATASEAGSKEAAGSGHGTVKFDATDGAGFCLVLFPRVLLVAITEEGGADGIGTDSGLGTDDEFRTDGVGAFANASALARFVGSVFGTRASPPSFVD